jgi:hypothetical protein
MDIKCDYIIENNLETQEVTIVAQGMSPILLHGMDDVILFISHLEDCIQEWSES